jgi:hypothetical protein
MQGVVQYLVKTNGLAAFFIFDPAVEWTVAFFYQISTNIYSKFTVITNLLNIKSLYSSL